MPAARALLFAVALLHTPAIASDAPIDGKKLQVRGAPRSTTPSALFRSGTPAFDPSLDPAALGSWFELTSLDCGSGTCVSTGGTGPIALAPERWRTRGTPTNPRGYRYVDPAGTRGGIRSVRLDARRLAVKARGDGWPWSPPGDAGTILATFRLGDSTQCAVLGGDAGKTRRNDPGNLWIANAPAPESCPAVCGNGMLEADEQCDGADAAACSGLCQADCTCPAPTCGNDVLEAGEECDGSQLGPGCSGTGYLIGCNSDCTCCTNGLGCDEFPCCSPADVCEPTRFDVPACRTLPSAGEACSWSVHGPDCAPGLACIAGNITPEEFASGFVSGVCLELAACETGTDCAAEEACVSGTNFMDTLFSFCAAFECSTTSDCPFPGETCEAGDCCAAEGEICDETLAPGSVIRHCCSAGLACTPSGDISLCTAAP